MKNQLIFSIFFLFLNSSPLFSQGGDDATSASGSPISLPFSGSGTTVGKTDTYNNLALAYGAGFSSGPDWLYYFCATSTTVVDYNLGFTPDDPDGVWPSISVWQGVPGVGTLITDNAVVGDVETSMTGQFIIDAGLCYYIMVDNWPPPAGFAYTLNLTLPPSPPPAVLQPECTNIGYESASFTGWQGTWANSVLTGNAGSQTPVYTPYNFNTTTSQHAITSGSGVDPIAGFPVVGPGFGNNSARLGDLNNIAPDYVYPNRGGATLEQKFSVAASNALFTYSYAVVIEDAIIPVYIQSVFGGDSLDNFGDAVPMPNWNNTGDSILRHANEEQPFFKVDLYDCSGNPIVCGQYLVTGGPNVPGFTQVAGSSIYYKDWTDVFIDLSAYIGTCVTIKYTTADCSLGGHFCYAYLDASCSPMEITGPTNICPSSTGILTAPTGGIAYSWSIVGDPTVLGTTKTLSVSPTATTNYQCVITSVSGCFTTLTYVVTLYPVTTVSSTTDDICNGSAGTITATGEPTGGTYSWAPGGSVVASLTQSPSTTTTYTATYTDPNLCTATNTGTITVNPLPVAPTTAPISYCLNTVTVPLTATAVAGHTLNWYGTDATGGVASGTAPTPSSATVGTTTYYVSQTEIVTGCEGPRASLVVTINALPTVTVNSPTICPTTSATLTANGALSYSWDSGASVSNPYIVTPVSTTTYTVVGTDVNNCENSAISTVTVSGTLAVTVNSPTICVGETAVLTADGGTTYSWDEGATLAVSVANPYSVSPTTTTTYTVTGTTNGCTGSATSTVTVNPLPVAPTTSPLSYCQNEVVPELSATALAGNTLNWYGTNATGGVGSSTAPIPSTTSAGTTTYYVSQIVTATGCEGPRASLDVIINSAPAPPITTPVSYCLNDVAIALIATPLVGSTLNWYGTNATGGVASSTAPTPTTSPAGTITYYVSQTNTASGCESLRSPLDVTINPLPLEPVTSPIGYCINAVPSALTATALAGNTINWYGTNATGGVASGSAPTPSTAVTGTTTYYVSQTTTATGCESPRESLIVTINPLPVEPSTAPITYCLNVTASVLIATPLAGNTLNWYGTNSSGGTASSIAPTPSTASVGTTTYYVSQTNTSTGCESPRASLDVIVNPLPLAPATTAVPYCLNDIAIQLVATALVGNTLNWYGTNATGGIASSLAPTPATSSVGNTTYYVSQTTTATTCEGPRSPLIVTVNPLPVTPLTSPISYCVGDSPSQLVATALAGNTLNWYGTSSTGGVASSTAPTPSTASAGVTTYYVSQTNTSTGCEGPRGTLDVTVNAPMIPDIQISPNTICEGSVAPILPSSSLDNPSIFGTWNPSVVDVSTTSDYVFTPNAGQCALPVTRTVTVNPKPLLFITNPGDTCEPATINLTSSTISAGSSGGTLSYWTNPSYTIPLTSPSSVTTGTYYIKSTSSLGCVDTSSVTVVINPLPFASFTPSPNVVTNLNPYSVMLNSSSNAISYSWDFGDGSPNSDLTSPDHYFPDSDSGTYLITLVAYSEFGCPDTAYATVIVNEELLFYVPNTFTPDKDSFNETFQPIFTSGFDPFEFRMLIFDRWGEVIFESHDASVGWKGLYGVDGTRVQDGTYTWKIEFTLKTNNQRKTILGHVNVLR